MRALTAGIPALSIALLGLPTAPATAAPTPPGAGAAWARAVHASIRRPHGAPPCSGTGGFIGIDDGSAAVGTDAAVLGGSQNFACPSWAAVGAGTGNQILDNGTNAGKESFIGGGGSNVISDNVAFIGSGLINTVGAEYGGIVAGSENTISAGASAGFIGGGIDNNLSSAIDGSIGGGSENQITAVDGSTTESNGASYGAIGGGVKNTIQATAPSGAQFATIGGGDFNLVSGAFGTIGGGARNTVSGNYATIPGGYDNVASGQFSYAGGFGSEALANGSFVWSDYSSGAPHLGSTKPNQFLVRATGGTVFFSNTAQTAGVSLAPGSGTWSSLSDRHMKDHIALVDGAGILTKLEAMPVSEWSYTSEEGVRHIGPMAQDFYAAFKVGEDDRHITTIDEDGVALAAVKALHVENDVLRERLARDEARHASEFAALEGQIRALARR